MTKSRLFSLIVAIKGIQIGFYHGIIRASLNLFCLCDSTSRKYKKKLVFHICMRKSTPVQKQTLGLEEPVLQLTGSRKTASSFFWSQMVEMYFV